MPGACCIGTGRGRHEDMLEAQSRKQMWVRASGRARLWSLMIKQWRVLPQCATTLEPPRGGGHQRSVRHGVRHRCTALFGHRAHRFRSLGSVADSFSARVPSSSIRFGLSSSIRSNAPKLHLASSTQPPDCRGSMVWRTSSATHEAYTGPCNLLSSFFSTM